MAPSYMENGFKLTSQLGMRAASQNNPKITGRKFRTCCLAICYHQIFRKTLSVTKDKYEFVPLWLLSLCTDSVNGILTNRL